MGRNHGFSGGSPRTGPKEEREGLFRGFPLAKKVNNLPSQ